MILRKVESLNSGVICFAYKDENVDWYYICVNDYEFYKGDQMFKHISKTFRKLAKNLKIDLVFCYVLPTEKMLVSLNEKNNLFLNIAKN